MNELVVQESWHSKRELAQLNLAITVNTKEKKFVKTGHNTLTK